MPKPKDKIAQQSDRKVRQLADQMSNAIVRKRGRPPKDVADAKREPISLRTTPEMRDKIVAAATRSGRSIAQEVESRLEMSFHDERIMGGSDTALLAKLVSSAVALVEIESGKPWTEDRMTWEAVRAAVDVVLAGFMPEIDLDIWERHRATALLPFMDAVYDLEAAKAEIDGLRSAYERYGKNWPPEAETLWARAWGAYEAAKAKVRQLAQAVFDGPMKEHEERRGAAVSRGRKLAYAGTSETKGNAVLAGVARFFFRSAAIEPLRGLKSPPDISSDEFMECVSKLAGQPIPDADAFVYRTPHWMDGPKPSE